MKFNMMIGGVETLFPEVQICYFEKDHEMVVYFLNTNKENAKRIENNIKSPKLRLEGNFLILLLKDFQYAFNIEGYETLIDFYNNGGNIGFAFEDEDGKILNIKY